MPTTLWTIILWLYKAWEALLVKEPRTLFYFSYFCRMLSIAPSCSTMVGKLLKSYWTQQLRKMFPTKSISPTIQIKWWCPLFSIKKQHHHVTDMYELNCLLLHENHLKGCFTLKASIMMGYKQTECWGFGERKGERSEQLAYSQLRHKNQDIVR